jgi:pimeloyl-ACP methyl ester carboxylesterase
MSDMNQVHVGPQGTFEARGEFASTPEDIDRIFDVLKAGTPRPLTLYFHGGLVNESSGIQCAEMMASVFESANNFPLCFVWETGLTETFRDNLGKLASDRLFNKILRWVLKRVSKYVGGEIGRGADGTVNDAQIEAELAHESPFETFDDARTGQAGARGGLVTSENDLETIKDELQAEFEADVQVDDDIEGLIADHDANSMEDSSRGMFSGIVLAKRLAHAAFRVVRRNVKQRDHGFYPTVIEEILREFYLADLGAWVWGRMKDKATVMWLPNDDRRGDEQRVGTYVLDCIDKLQAANPGFILNLVGHSAGSIVICHLLAAAAARHPNIRINKVVLLAPAVQSAVAVREIVEHPERFEDFRMYTMSDDFERKDVLVPVVYPRSLLYLVSGILEPEDVDMPIAGMLRFATRVAPFERPDCAGRRWAEFALNGAGTVRADSTELDPGAATDRRSGARKHGDFDNDMLTQRSLAELLRA